MHVTNDTTDVNTDKHLLPSAHVYHLGVSRDVCFFVCFARAVISFVIHFAAVRHVRVLVCEHSQPHIDTLPSDE